MFTRSRKAGRLLREAAATRPAQFLWPQRRAGWVLHQWDTQFGKVVLAHTVRGEMGMTFPSHALLRELADDAVALAVVEPDYNIPHGPSLAAIDAAGPDEYYGMTWRRLERVLGMPAPYWHTNLRDPELMMAWRPGAATVHVPTVIVPDPGPLLRLVAQEPDGSHPAAAALDTARRVMWDEAKSCHDQLAKYVDAGEDISSLALAARPLLPPEPPDVAEEILRDGWRTILTRTDTLAADCARLGQVLGDTAYFPGSCKVTVGPNSCAQAVQWTSRLQPSPRTALATYLGDDHGQDILIDPATDMPAVHTSNEKIDTVAPQRLPAHAPLAALTIDRRSVWVTTQDGMVFLAPQTGGGYTYGYEGGGPLWHWPGSSTFS